MLAPTPAGHRAACLPALESPIDPELLDLRNRTYAAFVANGRAPRADELGDAQSVTEGWRRLHEAHALVLNPATDEIRMANPFSAVPTAYRVQADGRWWFANCAWDAFGICAALHVDGRDRDVVPGLRRAATPSTSRRHADDDGFLFHCLVPAAHWWDDIVFT